MQLKISVSSHRTKLKTNELDFADCVRCDERGRLSMEVIGPAIQTTKEVLTNERKGQLTSLHQAQRLRASWQLLYALHIILLNLLYGIYLLRHWYAVGLSAWMCTGRVRL